MTKPHTPYMLTSTSMYKGEPQSGSTHAQCFDVEPGYNDADMFYLMLYHAAYYILQDYDLWSLQLRSNDRAVIAHIDGDTHIILEAHKLALNVEC